MLENVKRMGHAIAACGLAGLLITGASLAQDKQGAAAPAKAATPEGRPHQDLSAWLDQRVPKLESLIEKSMNSSPEIIVAQAKVKEAEANLQNAKAGVVQKIISLHGDRRKAELNLASAMNELQDGRASLERMRKIRAAGQASAEEERAAIREVNEQERRVADAQGKVSSADALLRLTVGETDSKFTKSYRMTNVTIDDPSVRQALLSLRVDGTVTFDGQTNSLVVSCRDEDHAKVTRALSLLEKGISQGKSAAGSKQCVEEKKTWVNEKLNTKLDCTFQQARVGDVVKYLQDSLNVPFVWTSELDLEQQVTLTLQAAQTGSILQALEDTTNARFFVRDYGFFVCPDGTGPMNNAVKVEDIWKANTVAGPTSGKATNPGK